jgi:hypothetical protein
MSAASVIFARLDGGGAKLAALSNESPLLVLPMRRFVPAVESSEV